MKWFLKAFTYWGELFSEIRIWWIFRQTCRVNKENLQRLNNEDLRVDWLGRIYGVINMPEEVQGAAPQIQQAYVMQQLNKWGPVTTELGLSDIIYPEMSRIPGTASYLIIMWPQYESLTLWDIIAGLFRTGFVLTGIWFLVRIIWVNFHYLADFISGLIAA
jgi:hypothetical protein